MSCYTTVKTILSSVQTAVILSKHKHIWVFIILQRLLEDCKVETFR